MQVYGEGQAAFRQLLLIYCQRLILGLWFDASPADSFSSCKTPVETMTTPCFESSLLSTYILCDIRHFSQDIHIKFIVENLGFYRLTLLLLLLYSVYFFAIQLRTVWVRRCLVNKQIYLFYELSILYVRNRAKACPQMNANKYSEYIDTWIN